MGKFKIGDWVRHKEFNDFKLWIVTVEYPTVNGAATREYTCRYQSNGVLHTIGLLEDELEDYIPEYGL